MHRRYRSNDSREEERGQDVWYLAWLRYPLEHRSSRYSTSCKPTVNGLINSMAEDSDATRSMEYRRYRHLEMLCICSVVVVLAFLLDVEEGGKVHFSFLPFWALPETCMSRDWFGVQCPGCGLTRSFIFLTEWEWGRAWSMHRLGWLMFILTAMQVPYRALALSFLGRELVPLSIAKGIGTILIALLIGNWLLGGVLFGPSLNGN